MFKRLFRAVAETIKSGSKASPIKEIEVNDQPRYLVGPGALSLEDARTLALNVLEAGEYFDAAPNEEPGDLPSILPEGLRHLFSRYVTINTLGANCFINLETLCLAQDQPGYYYVGEDMGSCLCFRPNEENIRSARDAGLLAENYPSVFHWILSVADTMVND